MQVPSLTSRLLLPALLLAACGPNLAAATRPPAARIPLESLGYIPFASPVLSSGASILTLNFVDDRHMLVTFSLRRLLKRIPNDPPQDIDRNIDAVLIDLPSGNILARTSWRMHDPAQYLWPLGNGHFLLRVRDRLTTIAPMRNLKSGDAFKEQPLLSSPKPIGAILLSPDASLLILEALDHLPPVEPERTPSPGTSAYAAQVAAQTANGTGNQTAPGGIPAPLPPPLKPRIPVEVHFYRLRSSPEGELYAQASGGLRARTLVSIPADGAGFLSVLDEGRQHWAFNYNFYRGKVEELSPFDSTCHPLPLFVSRSEFIAFGCRTGTQRQMFGGFNLRGEEMWEQAIPETYLNPGFAFAPSADRFAFGRVTTAVVVGDPASVPPEMYSSEVVTVHQTDSGRQVFRIECTPILPAGQNFDLSPDGADIAVIRDSAIEIHHLPPLTSKDRAGIAKAVSLAPEPTEGPILLTAPLTNANARAATRAGTPVSTPPTDAASHRPSAIVDSDTVSVTIPDPSESPAAPTTASATSTTNTAGSDPAQATAAPPPTPQPNIIENGDAQPQTEAPRKRPTLYNPGEHPDATQDKRR